MSNKIVPFSLKDAPALIERLLPVQKLSAEAYKEQMAGSGKTLTALGSYWKGRKPLILNKACILGCLLPATDMPGIDLSIFEKLMAMDDESFSVRWKRRFTPKMILSSLSINNPDKYFTFIPSSFIPHPSPYDWSNQKYENLKVYWRTDLSDLKRRQLEARMLPEISYRERVMNSKRAEDVFANVHDHIWDEVNEHLGTLAYSFPELVNQLGMMRFGHRPKVSDTFCGSGQIAFEAARLGCNVFASDLNPVACMLTWGSLNIIGGSLENRKKLSKKQQELVNRVKKKIDELKIETDGNGWLSKVFLYCVEVRCPQSGWMVPLLPTRIVSKGFNVIVELLPNKINKRYDIKVRSGVSKTEMEAAKSGTLGREGKYGEAFLKHRVDGIELKTKISTLREDFEKQDRSTGNKLRSWRRLDFIPQPTDLIQERLYCIQWMCPKKIGYGMEYEFRAVTKEDLEREVIVQNYISTNLEKWMEKGWLPDMRIEVGGPPRYQGLDLIKSRGWTYWLHVFNPRQLLTIGLVNQCDEAFGKFLTTALADQCSRLSRWNGSASKGAGGNTSNTFDNQALNTQFTYAHRGFSNSLSFLFPNWKNFPFEFSIDTSVKSISANSLIDEADIFITDPPYGDAVKYEEILDFFIAWIRKNPPPEFSDWIWDSRRSLAIKGEDEDFRRGMVAAYKRMTECMPDNGIQVIMFTHQSGSIWADMANIVWASGLQVTAAWYVVTETDSALREGSHVKGTVLLVCRKRLGTHKTTRDDLGWEIQEEVEAQIQSLTGLNQQAKGLYRDENVFEDADIQMAGYAAALRVLTRYAIIDGRDMTSEAIRPRLKGETTFVDGLIAFAVDTANRCLVPQGIPENHWEKLSGAERFYLKMVDLESRGAKTLDNYQNFAKAFKVRDFQAFMASRKANKARLKNAVEFGRTEMSQGSELHESVLRAVLYAMMELSKNVDGNEVMTHLTMNIPDYYGDMTQREIAVELSDYLANRLEELWPEEASAARVLRELVKNQRLG